jgi:DNA-binding NarL/FixJ family response regulator
VPDHGVILVEDDDRTRARLARAIEGHAQLRLLGAAASCEEARRLFARERPQVLITDLGLPDGDGVDLIREARRQSPETLVLVITVFGDEQHVVAAIEAGAMGYLLKDGTADYIGTSILEMIAGGSPISPPSRAISCVAFVPRRRRPPRSRMRPGSRIASTRC